LIINNIVFEDPLFTIKTVPFWVNLMPKRGKILSCCSRNKMQSRAGRIETLSLPPRETVCAVFPHTVCLQTSAFAEAGYKKKRDTFRTPLPKVFLKFYLFTTNLIER